MSRWPRYIAIVREVELGHLDTFFRGKRREKEKDEGCDDQRLDEDCPALDD